jgi:hypothetical protein
MSCTTTFLWCLQVAWWWLLKRKPKLAVIYLHSTAKHIFSFFTFVWPCIVINFLIIKPTSCTNFSNLFWKWNSTCFGQFFCPSSGVIHCTHSNGICHTDSFRAAAGSGRNAVPFWSCCCSKAVCKPVWHIPLLSVQWITPDDGKRNCPKHVEFHFQNKFEKLVHLASFIIRKFVTMRCYMNVKK